jgi:hypothetical protein
MALGYKVVQNDVSQNLTSHLQTTTNETDFVHEVAG